jgi:head-tail adaptor
VISSLLTQTVTVTTRTTGVADDYGNVAESWGSPVEYRARLEQQDGVETQGDQLVVTSRFLLILPASAVITAGDRVTDEDGNTFEVDGPPIKQRTPRGVHHIEARLVLSAAL